MSRTVAITGVSGGIGTATADAFRAEGWTVAGIDRVEPGAQAAVDAFTAVDLGDAAAGERLSAFLAGLPTVDALVNAAATAGTATLDATTLADWDAVLAANARGTFLAMRAAHAQLERSWGAVVNVASVHAVATSEGAGPYAASKGAIVALTRSAALEWAPQVRVNAVLPGAVDTAMLRSGAQRRVAADQVDEELAALAARTPLRRIGQPEEIADAILFLADGRRSAFITGTTLVVDGGVLARLSTE